MEKKLVSVIIPTYKRPLKLSRSIDSVLNQTYPNIEIIIVDDNNPFTAERKETEDLMEKYSLNTKVLYIKHEKNKNGSAARNTGFKNSNGEYIMFLDDDDEFLPNKIEVQLKDLEARDKTWGANYTKYKRMRNGKVDTISAEKREGDLYFEELCRNLFIQAGSNLMIRRSIIKELGGFNESFKRNQDIEFAVRLLKKYKLGYVDEMGLIYHRHPSPEKRNFDMEEITNHYIYSFKNYINDLSTTEKSKFYKMINLQLFRYYVVTLKDFKKGMKMLLSKNVKMFDVCRYFTHLLYRRIFKKSCGFSL